MRFILTLLALVLIPFSVAKAEEDPVTGLWLTQNERSVINIEECDEGVCGNVYWIIEGGMQKDSNNPDEAKRDTPMCGLKILWGFEKEEEGVWESGNIYKADDGDLYSAELTIQEDGTLEVHGYIGLSFIGKTQVWNKVSAKDYKRCS